MLYYAPPYEPAMRLCQREPLARAKKFLCVATRNRFTFRTLTAVNSCSQRIFRSKNNKKTSNALTCRHKSFEWRGRANKKRTQMATSVRVFTAQQTHVELGEYSYM